ncbi:ATPase [uncultured Tateyamaria sp.]|uniref:ATPase n=1 Tax=uncultured Tateyamaria sp. TaxID=455651 RepID=UPI00263061E3|nr:ATPase [uncultured Tateyamaria sp.]
MKMSTAQEFRSLEIKNIALIGMSGVGKTHLSNMLRATGDWFHYSVDYRIGSAYLASHIDDDLRRAAMELAPFPNLLRADAVTIKAKFGIDNLDAMSAYLGQIGDPAKGGMDRCAFLARQAVHKRAETAAMQDIRAFQDRARGILNYNHFVCDTSGSLCSVVDPNDRNDPILQKLARDHVLLYIEGDDAARQELIDRFCERPKPIYYSDAFFEAAENVYLETQGADADWRDVDPNGFAIWAFRRLIEFRLPIYRQIAKNWGYTIPARDLVGINTAEDFVGLIGEVVAQGNA